MKIMLEVIAPNGRKIEPSLVVSKRGWNDVQYFNLYHAGMHLGQVRVSIDSDHLFIMGMDNYTSNLPFSQRYRGVGRALHDIVFQASLDYGKKGRVELIADKGAGLFHMKCGFVHSEPGKTAIVEAEIEHAEASRVKGLVSNIYKRRAYDGPMVLPPEEIQRKIAEQKERLTEESVASYTPKLSAGVSHPIYQKVENLVQQGKLSRYNAKQLISKLLHPSHPGDQETWQYALSSDGLKAMALEFLSGWSIGVYFSQSNSPKLKHMLSPHGMYAFSQFLLGWQICSSLYSSTLEFILSDYGILILEDNPTIITTLYGKSFREKTLSQCSYERLQFNEITLDRLFEEPMQCLTDKFKIR